MSVSFNISGAPVELLEVGQLAAIHDSTKKVDMWLLETFFPNPLSFARKEVPVGEINTTTPLAPFVAPTVAGRPIKTADSGNVKYVKPAYLKPKTVVTPADVYNTALVARLRQSGILATGSNQLSPAEALLIDQIQKYQMLHDSIDNRKLLMGRDVLIYGKTTFESDDFPSYLVDYERSNACTFTPTIKWGVTNATPVADIQAMIDIAIDESGSAPQMALMSSKVFNTLMKDATFKDEFVTPFAGVSVAVTPSWNLKDRAQMKGTFGDIQFWVYDATITLDGSASRLIPADYFGLVVDTSGYVAHCAIQNVNAFGQPLEYFDYQWQEHDPSSIQLLCESSPLIVPDNKNGVIGGTGFINL